MRPLAGQAQGTSMSEMQSRYQADIQRCATLTDPESQRADCERLMSDSSAVEHGSVSGGGVLRELSITVPVDPAAPAGSYGAQPTSPPAYGTQPAPAPAPGYGAQPAAPGGYGQPAPASGG